MNYREYNPQQTQFFGYNPEDALGNDHLVYLVDEMVELLDLRKFYNKTSGPGNSAYDPRLMLKVLFFGYATGVFSSRKLQQHCQENLAFLHLTRGQTPRFRAICAFRVRHQENIKELFPQMLKIAKELKILRLGRLILDSTKIQANANRFKMVKVDKYDEVLTSINDYLNRAHIQDIQEDRAYGKESTGQELPKELRSKRQRMQRIKQIIEEAKRKNIRSINTTDPEAKLLRDTNTGRFKASYNIQTAIDADSSLIVAYKTTDTHSDNEHLEPMVKQAKKNTSQKPQQVDADSGYYSNASIAKLEKNKIDTCIPDSNTASQLHKNNTAATTASSKYEQEDFVYRKKDDTYICPQQKRLTYYTSKKQGNKIARLYRCQAPCWQCCDKSRCIINPNAKYRCLNIDPERKTLLRTKEKFKTKYYQERYKKRAALIERIFGHFKKNLKFTQFHLRGKTKVDVEVALLCMGFNFMVLKHCLWMKIIQGLPLVGK